MRPALRNGAAQGALFLTLFCLCPRPAGAADSRLQLGADLSYTSIEYKESASAGSPDSIVSSQQAVRAGVGLDVRLKYWAWLGLSGSVTSFGYLLSPNYSGPSISSGADPTPSIWEGAVRMSFSVLQRNSPWDLRIIPAVSGWGMWVPEEAIGVKYLIEPQLRVDLRRRPSGYRKMGLYLAGALHGFAGGGIGANRLLEAGADFQINSRKSRTPISLLGGYRDNAYDNGTLRMSLWQWWLGVSYKW